MSYLVAMSCCVKVWEAEVHNHIQPAEIKSDFRGIACVSPFIWE